MPEPVLLIGIPSEPPLQMVAAALESLGLPYMILNQRQVMLMEVDVALEDGVVGGVLEVDGESVPLEAFGGVYTRPMDHRLLPELAAKPPEDPRHRHADRFHEALQLWWELMPGRVVNRLEAMASNASKPFQAQLIARHFRVPETLVTNDPDAVLAFQAEFGRLVFKSVSGTRSVVHELRDEDIRRLDALRVCPAQFQERIEGHDLRVHTLEDGHVFGTAIDSEAADWRYAHNEAIDVSMRADPVDDELAERCLALATELGLAFAGIDLRITPDGEVYCFEVNPSPAYSAFEEATRQPISLALACYLADADGAAP